MLLNECIGRACILIWCYDRIIYGMSRDKNANQCIQLLLSVAQPKDVYFIQVLSSHIVNNIR